MPFFAPFWANDSPRFVCPLQSCAWQPHWYYALKAQRQRHGNAQLTQCSRSRHAIYPIISKTK